MIVLGVVRGSCETLFRRLLYVAFLPVPRLDNMSNHAACSSLCFSRKNIILPTIDVFLLGGAVHLDRYAVTCTFKYG